MSRRGGPTLLFGTVNVDVDAEIPGHFLFESCQDSSILRRSLTWCCMLTSGARIGQHHQRLIISRLIVVTPPPSAGDEVATSQARHLSRAPKIAPEESRWRLRFVACQRIVLPPSLVRSSRHSKKKQEAEDLLNRIAKLIKSAKQFELHRKYGELHRSPSMKTSYGTTQLPQRRRYHRSFPIAAELASIRC